MKPSTRDKIVQTLLDYRGQKHYEDWTGETVDIDVDYLKETLNRDMKGELVVFPKLIEALLGSNSQVLFVDGLNENVWDEYGEVEELTGVPEQIEWLASRKEMSRNDFSVVAFSNDKDGIAPMLAWLVCKDNYYRSLSWKKLGVLSNHWSMIEEYGIFSNRGSEGDIMYEEAGEKDDSINWWVGRMMEFRKDLAEEAGVIAFTVDFNNVANRRFFVRVLNWKEWPERFVPIDEA